MQSSIRVSWYLAYKAFYLVENIVAVPSGNSHWMVFVVALSIDLIYELLGFQLDFHENFCYTYRSSAESPPLYALN